MTGIINHVTASIYFYIIKTTIMSVIFLLLGASLVVALFFLIAFIWSVKDGQYEDDFSPAHRMLFDEKINND